MQADKGYDAVANLTKSEYELSKLSCPPENEVCAEQWNFTVNLTKDTEQQDIIAGQSYNVWVAVKVPPAKYEDKVRK